MSVLSTNILSLSKAKLPLMLTRFKKKKYGVILQLQALQYYLGMSLTRYVVFAELPCGF